MWTSIVSFDALMNYFYNSIMLYQVADWEKTTWKYKHNFNVSSLNP
jgi:hypothetical protein